MIVKRRYAEYQLVEDDSNQIEVYSLAMAHFSKHLGRQVGVGATKRVSSIEVVLDALPGQAKVSQEGMAILV